MRAPVQSKQSFAIPSSIVKSPSIKELVKDPLPVATSETAPESFQLTAPTQENSATPSANAEITPSSETSQTSETTPSTPQPETVEPLDNNQDTSNSQQVPEDEPAAETNQPALATESESSDEVPSIESTQNPDIVPEPAEDNSDTPTTTEIADNSPSDANKSFTIELLMEHWTPMVQAVFSQIPTIYASLLHYAPTIEQNIINIVLKNERQETDFQGKKHEVLAYLRANCCEAIEDIVLTIDINMETKKFILDDNDKYEELRRQNPDITDFIKILNLRIQS